MSVLIRKFYNLIFNGRTVSWSCTFNNSCINWRAVQVIPDDLMCFLICISQPAGNLVDLHIFRISCKGKRYNSLISFLLLHFWKINRPFVDSCRCSCLKTEHFNSVRFQGIRQMVCCLQTVWSGVCDNLTGQTSCAKISSRAQYDCLTMINRTWKRFHTCHFLNLFSVFQRCCFRDNFRNFCLTDSKMIGILKRLPHLHTVIHFICLSTQWMNGRTFGFI